ncbi:flavin monoamine oxidase family protein [Brevibacillus ginsengisoli]|uniref:flavin monoamine oxidase family protein n=1 Tax=Brevibacillus ginsengisoli TaxID=363854 RepID=UPI003CFACBB6
MARTSLFQQLQQSLAVAREAWKRNVPVEQVIEEHAQKAFSRREFLHQAAMLTAAVAVPSFLWNLNPQEAHAATAPKIAVIGAGLAGLTCAYRLKQAGLTAQVYEASSRVGGRCWSRRGDFEDGQIAEHGGELIDQDHKAIRHLAQELGLTLDNLVSAEKNGTQPLYYFDNEPYTYTQATRDIKDIWQKLHRDVIAAGFPTLYNSYTDRGYALDHMSIVDWIEESVQNGMNSKLGKLLDVAYNIEFGGESSDQSSLNLLYLLGYLGQGQLRMFGASNEKYHVRGGNDRIATSLANYLDGQIHTGEELTAIRKNSDDTYSLTFGSRDIQADIVVMTIPFSILRSSVDYSDADFRKLKKTAIEEYGFGTNSKLFVQFTDRHWEGLNCNGDTISDTGYQNTWEVSRGQGGRSGILVNYTGGLIGESFNTGSPTSRAQQFLQQIEPVLPGIRDKWNGRAEIDYWTGYRWTKGSYAYYRVGQYTKFAGIEREAEGNCYFAGEHTSIDYQGYLNGAVDSGEQAAKAIVASSKSVKKVKRK